MPNLGPPTTPSLVDIPTAEYTQRRHVSELCRWINEKFAAIRAGGRFDEQYFERTGLNVKRLIEEVVPLSRLGLFLWQPGCDVYVTCHADNRNYDAEVEVEGWNPRSFRVEATTTETDESTLRRQALSRDGFSTLSGPIHREGRTIVPEFEMTEASEDRDRYVALTFERLRAKVESGRYDSNTAILVHLADFCPLSPEGRAQLIRQTTDYLQRERPRLPAVYYCYLTSYSVDAVYPPPTGFFSKAHGSG
jgi:hypothetical protein